MRKIKSIFSILLKIILVCFLFFIFYLIINKVFVGEKKILTNNFTLTLNSNEGIYLSTPIDNFEDFLAISNYTEEDIDKDLLKIDIDNYMVNNSFENYFLNPKVMAELGIVKSEEHFWRILFSKWKK